MGTGILPDWQQTQQQLAPEAKPTFLSTPDEDEVTPEEWMPEGWNPDKRTRLFTKKACLNLAVGGVLLIIALLLFWRGLETAFPEGRYFLWFVALLFAVSAFGRLGWAGQLLINTSELSPKPDVVVRRFVGATLAKGPLWDPAGAMAMITPVGRVGLGADSPERFWEACDKAAAEIATKTAGDAAAFALIGMRVACLDPVPLRRHRLSRAVVDLDTRAQSAGVRVLYLTSGLLFQPLINWLSRSSPTATCRLNLDLIQAPSGDWYVAQMSLDFRRLGKGAKPQSAEF